MTAVSSIRLSDLVAPRESNKPLLLSLDYLLPVVQADIVVARVVDDGKDSVIFGRFLMEQTQRLESARRSSTIVIEVTRDQFDDLQKVIAALKGVDQYHANS